MSDIVINGVTYPAPRRVAFPGSDGKPVVFDLPEDAEAELNGVSSRPPQTKVVYGAMQELKAADSKEAADRLAEDTQLQAQIDQLVAPTGEAPSAAEVENARIGTDSHTYPTLGEAVRGQAAKLQSGVDVMLAGYPEVPQTYESGSIATTGASSSSTAYIRTKAVSRPKIQAGDTIISDGVYYFTAAVYNSRYVTSSSFVAWITPDGRTTAGSPGRKLSFLVIPEEYVGMYLVICAHKASEEPGSSDISADVSTLSDHIKVVQPQYVKAGAEALEAARARQKEADRNLDILNQTAFETVMGRSDFSFAVGLINTGTGANGSSDPSACRTNLFVPPKTDLLAEFGDPDYEWTCWSYSGTAVTSGTHANTSGGYQSANQPISVKYASGDKYIRFALRRVDGAAMTTDLEDPDSDYSKINAGITIRYHYGASADRAGSVNLIDMGKASALDGVSIEPTEGGGIHAYTTADGSYRCFRVLANPPAVLKPHAVYAMRIKVDSISGTAAVCGMRFRGTDGGSNYLALGIGSITSPGEYATFYRATGYETRLDVFLTSGTSSDADITVSEIMLAETDISLPFVEHGIRPYMIAGAVGAAADGKSWGVQNALAHATQYTQVKWTPVGDMPSQFSSIGNKFAAGEEVMGVPYSSARGVDKLIGPQVSLHTFLSAAHNPDSVLYTRQLTYSNARTYYGSVCSAFVGHCYGLRVNLKTADLSKWDRLVPIDLAELMPGDLMLCSWHSIMITGVYRDQYGRILSVGWCEAGDPVVKNTMALSWPRFVRWCLDHEDPGDVWHPYRYMDVHGVAYAKEEDAVGYPDETEPDTVWPDIMSEYGDRAVLREGEDTEINVISGDGYDAIAILRDGDEIQTRSSIADFTLRDLQPGLYEIVMTGDGKESSTSFFVCETQCGITEDGRLSFSSGNAAPVAVYTYNDSAESPSNRLVPLTEADIAAGEIDLSDYLDETFVNAKIAFAPADHPDWGVATWYTRTPEEMGLWTEV